MAGSPAPKPDPMRQTLDEFLLIGSQKPGSVERFLAEYQDDVLTAAVERALLGDGNVTHILFYLRACGFRGSRITLLTYRDRLREQATEDAGA